MKKSLLLLIVVMSHFVMVGISHAGAKFSLPVVVTATTIYGNFGSTRNSANAIEYFYYFDYGSSVRVYARNAAGTTASCVTTNPTHTAIIRRAVDSSYLYIALSAGTCTSVRHANGSVMEPKV